jgi:hypothetical protein
MRSLCLFVGAIATTLINLIGVLAIRGQTVPAPISPGVPAQTVFHCSESNLDCGDEPGYFTLIEPQRRTWQRLSSIKPTLGQLVLAFGAPEGTAGPRIVTWKGLYAELSQPLSLSAPVNALVLAADVHPTAPWNGFLSERLLTKEIHP